MVRLQGGGVGASWHHLHMVAYFPVFSTITKPEGPTVQRINSRIPEIRGAGRVEFRRSLGT